MLQDDFEDYSVDMRTILAKERTLLAEQRTQLSIVAIGLGLFATGFTLLRVLDGNNIAYHIVELFFLMGGAITATMAVMHYFRVQHQLKLAEKMEKKMALRYHMMPQK